MGVFKRLADEGWWKKAKIESDFAERLSPVHLEQLKSEGATEVKDSKGHIFRIAVPIDKKFEDIKPDEIEVFLVR